MKYLVYLAFISLGFYIARINLLVFITLFIALIFLTSKKLAFKQLIIGTGLFFFCALLTVHLSVPKESKDISTFGIIIEAKKDYYIIRTASGRFYVSSKNNNFEYFDIIKIKGVTKYLEMHAIESDFDFKQYLNNQGVFNELKVTDHGYIYKRIFRNKIVSSILCSGMNHETCILTQNLVLAKNEKSDISNYASLLGITYLFTVSGYCLTSLLSGIKLIYKYLGIKKYRVLLSYITLIPYCLLIIHRFVVMRMFAIAIIQYINNKTVNKRYLFVIFCSFIFFLCLDFYLIYQLKFYLPYIMSMIFILTKRHVKKDYLSKVIHLLIVYIFISIFVLNEYELSIMSFILRVILMPILLIIFIIASLTAMNILPSMIINKISSIIYDLLKFFADIDLKIVIGKNDVFIAVGLIFTLVCYLISLSLKNKKITQNVALGVICIIMARPLGMSEYLKSAVYFIDVGQGDCALVQKGNTHVLIDTGGNLYKDIASDTLIPFFKKNRINNIDAVIISHSDFDHDGALSSLVQDFNVKRIIRQKTEFPLVINNLEFSNLNNYMYLDDNSNSLVIYLNFMQKKWLFMGDASKDVELNILKKYPQLDVDVIKIGHHGSNTSSDKSFLRSISPDEAIISAGYLNSYGHPHKEVLSILNSLNIRIRRTDLEGTIIYQKYSF